MKAAVIDSNKNKKKKLIKHTLKLLYQDYNGSLEKYRRTQVDVQ